MTTGWRSLLPIVVVIVLAFIGVPGCDRTPVLLVSPISIDFGELRNIVPFTIQNIGRGNLGWEIVADFPDWLQPSAISGTTASGMTSSVDLFVLRARLSPGTYTHTVTMTSNGGQGSVQVTVTMAEEAMLVVSPMSVEFGPDGIEASFTIQNPGSGTLSWSISPDLPGWLQALPMSSETPAASSSTVALNVLRTGLSPGVYAHAVSITSDGGDATVDVTMSVAQEPTLSVTPTSLDLGTTDTEASFAIHNTGGGTLTWDITSEPPEWLQVSATSGETASGAESAIVLTVSRTGLPPGLYNHNISVTSNGGDSSLDVSMAIEELPALSVSPASVDFGTTETEASFAIHNTGGGTLTWDIASQPPEWLQVSAMSGETQSGAESTIVLTVDRTGLDPGVHTHTMSITSNGGDGSVDVCMAIEEVPVLSVTPASVDFGSAETEASFSIQNIGGGSVTWDITSQPPAWLQLSAMSGETQSGAESVIVLTVDRTGLDPGVYTYTISITSNGGDAMVHVTMSVAGIPALSVTPASVDFGPAETEALFSIQNIGGGTLTWDIASQPPEWLQVSAMSGETQSGAESVVVLTVDRTGLDPGVYTHTMSITSNGGDGSVDVSMAIEEVPALSVTPASVDFGTTETEASFTIQNIGGGTLTWDMISEPPEWMQVSALSGETQAGAECVVVLTVSRTDLDPGVYTDTISVTSNGGDGSVDVSMAIEVVPALLVSPAAVDFGTTESEASFTIQNTGGGTLTWDIASEPPEWLLVSTVSGETQSGAESTIVLTLDRTGLDPGEYTHTISVTSNGGDGSLDVYMAVPQEQG